MQKVLFQHSSGDKNIVSGDKSIVSGDKNIVSGDKNIVSGDKNIVSGDKNIKFYNTPSKVSKSTILNFLSINDYITTNIAIDLLNLKSKSWVRSILNQMVKDGILTVEGNNRNRKYKLKN